MNEEDCLKIVVAVTVVLFLGSIAGCGFEYYKGNTDGSTTGIVYGFGRDTKVMDFHGYSNGKVRKIDIGSAAANETRGLEQIKEITSLVVEGAVKGAIQGAK